ALAALDAFFRNVDAQAFASFMEKWCRKPGYDGFRGPSGQMFLNQLLKAGEPGEAALLLSRTLQVPVNDHDAVAKIDQVLEFVHRVKSGAHPAPGRVSFLLSFFWGLQEPDRWPMMWSSAKDSLVALGWLTSEGSY